MAGYNHYTPLSDGSYRRSTVPEGSRRSGQRTQPQSGTQPSHPRQEPPAPPKQECPEPPKHEPPPPQKPEHNPPCPTTPSQTGESILSFLKGLLPRQIDAADLLVISLLLLMNREEDCEGISPLLTIALYFLL